MKSLVDGATGSLLRVTGDACHGSLLRVTMTFVAREISHPSPGSNPRPSFGRELVPSTKTPRLKRQG
jgi:hypothetical protein